MTYTFEYLSDRIMAALKEKGDALCIPEKKLDIVDSFFMQDMKDEIDGKYGFGGPTIPCVVLIGKESGRIYYVALRYLLPDLEII